MTAMEETGKIPSLKAGDGLPARHVALCDGRTSMRLSQAAGGFDNLVHYSPDSFYVLSRVLASESAAIRWSVDGRPHEFGWTEVYPFGYLNHEERAAGDVTSRCLVVEGGVLWTLSGVQRAAEFVVPRAMFVEFSRYDGAQPREVTKWEFGPDGAGEWIAVRREEWLFRDCSTYAGIEGVSVPSEPRQSELHLCVCAGGTMRVEADERDFRFELTPGADGCVRLALGLGMRATEARDMARRLAERPMDSWEQQTRRYAAIAAGTPQLDFGRHTALRRFFRLEPLYLDSMRIADDPGAYRANNDYYWVWGWDMTRPAFGLLTGGRHDFVRDLLDFLVRTRFINQYDNTLTKDLRWCERQPGALDYMLAHDYLAWTGDLESTKRWAPAFREGIELACRNEDPTGMTTGVAASTDFPEEFGRTFKAWMSYNTAWSYSGFLCAEKLLLAWGDEELAARVRELASRIRRNFVRVFWNPATGFWNEGVHPTNPDLVCDIPLSTATAAMDSPYGEDLYADKLAATAAFCAQHFLRDDGVYIVARGEKRGWKEWTRQPNNWFAANDTMLARLFRTVGNVRALEKLFYLYEINFGYQPCAFEGKPLYRPLNTSGSWQAFGAGAWYRNLVEAAAGLWADLGGIGIMPGGLGEPVRLQGLRFREATIDFEAKGQGLWPQALRLDGRRIEGTTRLPPLEPGRHEIAVEYGPAQPAAPLLTLAVDAAVREARARDGWLTVTLEGRGYTPISFFSQGRPTVKLNGAPIAAEWDEESGRGRARLVLDGAAALEIESA